jgi:Fe-S cluster assembly protein SufD
MITTLNKLKDFTKGEQDLVEFRERASGIYAKSSFPSKKDEDWQFIDLDNLQKQEFEIATPVELTKQDLISFELEECSDNRLVFVNGYYQAALSSNRDKGIYVGNFATIKDTKRAQLTAYLQQNLPDLNYFSALNQLATKDLAIVWVEADVEIAQPIQLLFLASANSEQILIQPHIVVIIEPRAKVQLLESYHYLETKQPYWNNSFSEIFVGENAKLEHVLVQWQASNAFHIAQTTVQQKEGSYYSIVEVDLGSQLCRHNLDIIQAGKQTDTKLWGLALAQDEQTIDLHSKVDLHHPYGTVEQLQKCILADRSSTVFNGKISVPQSAQMTNAAQLNRNLILSSGAKVYTKPELEITADNVKCAHGATISQLEDEEIFYLRSRGLTLANCRRLLLEAFAIEIINKIPYKSLSQKLTNYIK